MPREQGPWRDALAATVARAPAALRALASEELHIGGFTNVRLDHPVLDLRPVADDGLAERALLFFLAGALLQEAAVARVHVRAGAQATALASLARRRFRAAVARVDDESAALLRYFDVYLRPSASLDDKAAGPLVRTVARALETDPRT